jgi:outer membrane protein assembly factor BamA
MVAHQVDYRTGAVNIHPFRLVTKLCYATIAILLLSSSCIAQEVVTGWEGGPSTGYGFISPMFSIPVTTTDSVVVKPTAGYLYYDTHELGGVTKVTSPGVSLGLGYRYSGPRLTVDIGPAIEVLWERKAPAIGPDTNETLVGTLLAGDAFFQATPLTNFNLIASYDQTNRYFWSRAGVKQRVTDLQFQNPWALLLGAEVTGQGNKDIRQYGVGGLVEFAFDKLQTSLQIRAGYSWIDFSDHTKDSRPYIGAGLYHHF